MIGKLLPLFSVAAIAFALASTSCSGPTLQQPSPQPCSVNPTSCSSGPANATGSIKWHPGHYMMIRNSHKHDAEDLGYVTLLANEPMVTGVLRDWMWKDIETGKGVYDFSEIDAYLNALKSMPNPKRFIIRIENRSFGGHDGSVVPDYMLSDPIYMGGNVPMSHGLVARIWEAPVMDRLIALIQALAQRYDSNPYVEGISTSETAIGFSSEYLAPSTFSTAALLTQLQRYVTASRLAWFHSNVFIETNFLGSNSQMQELLNASVTAQAVVGGPDVVPDSPSQSDKIVQGAAGKGTDYRGTVAIKSEVQATELGLRSKFPLPEIYDVAYNTNHANYILWDRNDSYGTPDVQWTTGILPFIRSDNGKTYTTCPSSYLRGCFTN